MSHPRSRPRSQSQNRHIAVSRIAGVVVYRVDNPLSGCSAGFWTTRVLSRSRPPSSSSAAGPPRSSSGSGSGKETRVELDFQHAPPGRCRCLGRDTDSPAVRELLDMAMGLVVPQITAAAGVVWGGTGIYPRYHHHHHHHYEAGSMVAAMLVFLKRALRLPALGDAELDLWDDVCWPPPSPCAGLDGEYGFGSVEAEVEVGGEEELSWQQRLLVGISPSRPERKRSNKLKKKKQEQQQPERWMTAPPQKLQKTKQPTGDRGRAGSGSGRASSSPPWWRGWVLAFSSQVGGG